MPDQLWLIYTLIKKITINIIYKALDICAIFVDDFLSLLLNNNNY